MRAGQPRKFEGWVVLCGSSAVDSVYIVSDCLAEKALAQVLGDRETKKRETREGSRRGVSTLL